MFRPACIALVRSLVADPSLLKRAPAATMAMLQTQGREGAQGTGNKVTEQEGSFADIATAHGFSFLAKDAPAPSSGLHYLYQMKGSQQPGDFGLQEYADGKVIHSLVLDLKHTLSKSFYLNDGWFHDDVVYVISHNTGTAKYPVFKTHVALGQDIPTEEEQAFMKEMIAFKVDKNSETKKVGSLRPYVRFANQYSCERFTSEVAAASLERVISSLSA